MGGENGERKEEKKKGKAIAPKRKTSMALSVNTRYECPLPSYNKDGPRGSPVFRASLPNVTRLSPRQLTRVGPLQLDALLAGLSYCSLLVLTGMA